MSSGGWLDGEGGVEKSIFENGIISDGIIKPRNCALLTGHNGT